MDRIIEYSEAFTEICRRNLEDMFGVASSVAMPSIETNSIETTKDLIVSLFFTGTVYGEYILALDECVAAKIVGIEGPITDENRKEVQDEICDALTETLNTIVGEAIVCVQNEHPKLTLTAPRVFFGEVRYPQFRTARSLLETGAGDIECHFFIDLMRLSVADSYEQVVNSLENANKLLIAANLQLKQEIEGHVETQKERDSSQTRLVEASRLAGMAEVATSVLHNVGNILNSINVSATVIRKQFDNSAFAKLKKVSSLISENRNGFACFVKDDDRGQKIPDYILRVTDALTGERSQIDSELRDLSINIEHIRNIVSVQQSRAKSSGLHQEISPATLVEDAISADRRAQTDEFEIVIELEDDLPDIVSDKHKILQILLNLIQNARDALAESQTRSPRIQVGVSTTENDVVFGVIDNGIGISEDRLDKIFQQGFSTKETGHGFGLHTSANAATELGGTLTVSSPGVGQGATFQLRLPRKQVRENAALSLIS